METCERISIQLMMQYVCIRLHTHTHTHTQTHTHTHTHTHKQRLLRHVAFEKSGLRQMSSTCNYPMTAMFTNSFVFQTTFKQKSKSEPRTSH